MVTPRIPVVVLAGFLGSGKTTLLNHLLRHSGDTRIGAVVNDFGSIEIDAMTVAGQVDSMVSLGNGCLCCAVDTGELDEVLEVLARPTARMDVIVVEASGLAEPETMIRMILASENPHIRYGGLVEVVDAAEFPATRRRHPELERHLRAADLVVLNKADRAGTSGLETLGRELAELCPGIPVVPTAHGRIDPGLLFDRPDRPRPAVEQLSFDSLLRAEPSGGCACGDADHPAHLHTAYRSVEFASGTPVDPRRLLDFLDRRPDGVYRIKGFVDFGRADRVHKYAVHSVGGFLRFEPVDWTRAEARRTELVLIGTGMDAEALLAGLAACATDPAQQPDPHALWGVLRHVDEAEDPDDLPDGYQLAETGEPYAPGAAVPGNGPAGSAGSAVAHGEGAPGATAAV